MHSVILFFKNVFGVLKDAYMDFMDDDCTSQAAALSYYTIFSLPALLAIIVTIVGAIWGQEAASGEIQRQIESLIGSQAASEIQTMIANAGKSAQGRSGLIASLIGIGVLIFGATGAFIQLQSALNTIWEVAPDPDAGGIKNFLSKRLLSFGMILAVGFLLLVSLAASAAISAFGDILAQWLPAFFSGPLLSILNFAVSLLIITILFAAIFKILPDAVIRWKDVGMGAFFTAILFVIGKTLIGLYLGRSNVASAYGAAGSLALILVWIYYSSLILFWGAELTQSYARHIGAHILPAKGAVRIVREKRHVNDTKSEMKEHIEPVRPTATSPAEEHGR